jgi:NADH dehydrogenase FAD-containing subunit
MNASTSPTVAVVGGGYGGTAAARALDDVADVVLVEPRDAFVHNIAALRAAVDPDFAPTIFLPYHGLLTHGRVVRDRAVEVEPGRVRLASGAELHPDYIVLATGSSYPFPAKSDVDDSAEATKKFRAQHAELATADAILLLGAGPVGIELAGEITTAWPEKRVILADVAEDILAGPYLPELRDELRRQLAERNVELVLGATDPVNEIEADVVLRTHGVHPETGYLAGDLAAARTPGGRIAVGDDLRVAGQERVFALGDIADGHVQKAAVAGLHAPVVAGNIRTLIDGGSELAAFEAMPPAIFVPLGPDGGAGQMPGATELSLSEEVSAIKGRDLLIGRSAEVLGLVPAKTS